MRPSKELLELARDIVDRYGTFVVRNQVSSYGSMRSNITHAVVEGIKTGIEIGKLIERGEIMDQLMKRNGETDETEACDEAVSLG